MKSKSSSLNSAGVHKNPNSGTQGRRGKVAPESGTNNSTATVWAGHLAPNAPELRAILLGLGLINVGQSLPKIPVYFLRSVYSFDLKK